MPLSDAPLWVSAAPGHNKILDQLFRSLTSLFDGKTLDGWIQIENSATSLSVSAIADPAAFLSKLTNGTDAVSLFLRRRLEDLVKADLATYSATNAKALLSAVVKDINELIHGPSIFDSTLQGCSAPARN